MTDFDQLLESYRSLADSERMKGNYLEQLVEKFLRNDGVHGPQYKAVWLWKDWPDRPSNFSTKDNGIDLVGAREDGGLAAIQVKFFAGQHTIQKSDIDSFLAASAKAPFTHAVVVDTTEGDWSKNAEEMLDGRHIPVQRIGLSDFRHSNIDWSTYNLTAPQAVVKLHDKNQLRPHQHEAVKAALEGFQTSDRGKLIMACGTGKTFTALKLAERLTEDTGHARILFMVPSLALMSQSLKEWSDQTEQPMHAYAVCSDRKVGRVPDTDLTDVAIHDLQIPATTNGKDLVDAMGTRTLGEGMTVVFSTYHSIDAVHQAQQAGLPEFDLIICDEAHRTTGATIAGQDESHFVKIHDDRWVAGAKRLYMTATPRIFNDNTKNAAQEKDAVLCSMDDQGLYGPVFHRIGFGEAVTKGLLTDYKVLVLGVDETQVAGVFQQQLADSNNELAIDDVAKLIGCWNGLAKRRSGEFADDFGADWQPMKRAVAFNSSIRASKTIEAEFEDLVRVHLTNLDNEDPTDDLRVEVRHIDGGFNAIRRSELLDWLKAEPEGRLIDDRTAELAGGKYPQKEQPACRILTNARCLTEGVDVPSLDAVLFMNPRNSMVDVIQAVGRVMRNYKNPTTGEVKSFGYIVLPIAIPEGMSTSEALKDNQRYKVVWQVLQALRAHDERMDAAINQIELNKNAPESIIVDTVDLSPKPKGKLIDDQPTPEDEPIGPKNPPTGEQLSFTFPFQEWKDAVYAKIVDKCGNRMYWEDWSKDIASIAKKHIDLIQVLLEEEGSTHRIAFEGFVQGLRENLNPAIDDAQAIEMLAQHLVTKPVFDAMFADSNFTEHNSVSRSMQSILDRIGSNAAFEKERSSLEAFYDSVRRRVEKVDNAEAKQKIIIELYDKFFRNAFPRVANRLGIVFTPVPVVDYILRSADAALKLEFGKSLSDEGVSIIDPFVGTGSFITRLLQSGLIKGEDLPRKYTMELFANEIVLLSYYIAAINIETVYSEVARDSGLDEGYVPFDGIALTDTFQLNEGDGQFESGFFPENTERVKRQKNQDIRVVVMNPPYSVGQESANDNNQNQKYELLDLSISKTYAVGAEATNLNTLYDSYFRAIRWATDRVGGDGIIAFVSNGSFVDGLASAGFRKSLRDEFAQVFVYDLRGGTRGRPKEAARREGGNVFDIMTPVAICVLVKKADHVGDAQMHYSGIGDYLTKEEKLDLLVTEGSIAGTVWDALEPNSQNDWINVRNESYVTFQPLGEKATKGKPNTPAIVRTYSRGLETGRDSWIYSFSRERAIANTSRMIDNFNLEVEASKSKEYIENIDPTFISWTRGLRSDRDRGTQRLWEEQNIVSATYRPFCRQTAYFSRVLNHETGQLPRIFPSAAHPNLVIAVSTDRRRPFSALIVDGLPDIQLMANGQCFPLYTYEAVPEGLLPLGGADSPVVEGLVRQENVTDATLLAYRAFYEDDLISKDDIFYYVYGLLHSPAYKLKYKSDLMKTLPRIPKVGDFWAFSKAGRDLAELHLGYESVTPADVAEVQKTPPPSSRNEQYDYYRLTKMSWRSRKDRSCVVYNQNITLEGIPEEVFEYQVNGKSAIEWVLDRYQVSTHKDSQIVNDPNDYCREVGNPRYVVELLKRIVTVSLETNRIVAGLPPLEILE